MVCRFLFLVGRIDDIMLRSMNGKGPSMEIGPEGLSAATSNGSNGIVPQPVGAH